jgi:hypothetical protein
MVASERLAEFPSRGRAITAGIIWGGALSVKFPALFLAVPLLHAARGRFVLVAAAAAVVALGANPALLSMPFRAGDADAPEHTTLLGNLRRTYSADFHDWTLPYAHDLPAVTELTRILPFGIGILAEIFAAVGIFVVMRDRVPRSARLLLILLPIVLAVMPARVHTVRFLLPMFPALAILAARGVQSIPIPGASAVLVVATLMQGLAFSSIYAQEDARVAAGRWLDEHVQRREVVLVEDPPGYGPPLDSPSNELPRAPLRYDILWRNFYTVHERRTEPERRRHIEELLERADFLALSEGHRAEFMGAGDLRPVERKFYEDLDAGRLPFRKAATFKQYPRLGPIVLRDDRAETLMRVFDHPRIDIWQRVPGSEIEQRVPGSGME